MRVTCKKDLNKILNSIKTILHGSTYFGYYRPSHSAHGYKGSIRFGTYLQSKKYDLDTKEYEKEYGINIKGRTCGELLGNKTYGLDFYEESRTKGECWKDRKLRHQYMKHVA